MDNLWAPWRMKYILGDKDDGCFLCEKVTEDNDNENFILERGTDTFVILNIYPYNNGHLMIVPYKHVADLDELNEKELLESSVLTKKWISILKKVMNPEGFNIGVNLGTVAGAGIKDHLHTHIVPRWNGDTNFMPVIADTKVIPQALTELYELLKEARGKKSEARKN